MTRSLIVFLISLLLIAPAHSDERARVIEVCTSFSEIVKAIMADRQVGKPMSETLPTARAQIESWFEENFPGPDMSDFVDLADEFTVIAYEMPVLTSEEHRMRLVAESENSAFKACYTKWREVKEARE